MRKRDTRYIWTEKAQKLPNSKAKAGELATFNGHVLTNTSPHHSEEHLT